MSEKKLTELGTSVEDSCPGLLAPPHEKREVTRSHIGVYDRNLDAKRALAEELTSMGFTEAQTRRILHIGLRDADKQQNTSAPDRTARRGK